MDGLRPAVIAETGGWAARLRRPPIGGGTMRPGARVERFARGAVLAVAAMACERGDAALPELGETSPGYIVDSIRPVDEEIRRFQASLPRQAHRLAGGAPSRDSLVRAFLSAVEANDTTALVRLMIDRVEFGYLVYPTSRHARPPYRQSPDIVWLRIRLESGKSAGRLLARLGGQPLAFVGYRCWPTPEVEGPNRVWRGCVVRRQSDDGAVGEARLFGDVVERDGRFKFLSLANSL